MLQINLTLGLPATGWTPASPWAPPSNSPSSQPCPCHGQENLGNRFAMMRQLQMLESMLEVFSSMLGAFQGQGSAACPPWQNPLPLASPPGPQAAPQPPHAQSQPQAQTPGGTQVQAPAPAQPQPGGGAKSGAPAGYKPMRGAVPPAVVARAKSLLSQPMGSEHPFEINGKRYLARLEHHYHPPGYQGGPNGWHKGVTVYEAT